VGSDRVAPADAALPALNLSREGRVGAIQRVNRGVDLAAVAVEDAVIRLKVVVQARGPLVFVAATRIVETETSGVQDITRVAVVGIRQQTENRLHCRIDALTAWVVRDNVELLDGARPRCTPLENTLLGQRCENGAITNHLRDGFAVLIVEEEEQVVALDAAADGSANEDDFRSA